MKPAVELRIRCDGPNPNAKELRCLWTTVPCPACAKWENAMNAILRAKRAVAELVE